MPIRNVEIAEAFNRLADFLEIEGAKPFRVRAYRNAARTVQDLPRSAAALLAAGEDFRELPGIGRDLAGGGWRVAMCSTRSWADLAEHLRRR